MRFEAPTSLDAAVALLDEAGDDARVLAGGSDLLVQLRSGMVEPGLIVDIKRIDELHTITEEDGAWRIGAAVPAVELGEHKGLKDAWPGVVEAANLIGSTQIQSRATLVGNLCNASPAADTTPALIAADARVRAVGPEGAREIAAEDFVTGPGKSALKRGELVHSVLLPARPERAGDAYLRFIPRTEMDIAVVGAGVSLVLDSSGKIESARVGLGAVAATPLRADAAAEAIIGTTLDDAALEKLAAAASDAAQPIDDKRGTKDYRIHVAGVLARRAARIAMERAGA